MANLIFDPENHIYTLDGVAIPFYSAIAKAEGLSDYFGVNSEVMEAARKFGDAGHLMLKLFVEDNLDEGTLDANLIPYLNGYKKFAGEHEIKNIPGWIECPTFSARWRYGIKPDWIGYVDGKVTVIEWKFTSAIMPSVAIQTAAQKVAFEEQTKMKVSQRWGLQLLENNFHVEPFRNTADEMVWFSALNIYTWRRKNKLIKEA